SFATMIAITFAALRFGEVGMDIFKSLRPLVCCLLPTSDFSIHTLREQRAELSERVTDLINTLGPEMFPDFEQTKLVSHEAKVADGVAPAARARRESEPEEPPVLSRRSTTKSSMGLPRNESFNNIGGVGIFSTRPP